MAGEKAEGNASEDKATDDEDDSTLYYFPGVGCKTKKRGGGIQPAAQDGACQGGGHSRGEDREDDRARRREG